MSPEAVLNEIRDEVKKIQNKLDVVARLEERVNYHHETLGRFGKNIDVCTAELNVIKISMAGNKTSTLDIQSLIKWGSGIVAAFIIATYLNGNNTKAAPVIPQDKHFKIFKVIIKEGKK